MAPTLESLTSILRLRSPPSPHSVSLAARAKNLIARNLPDPSVGVVPPERVPNKAIFIILGLIGVGFVVTGIWFFFWAKNGGFHFQENDWDDYKSTVLRRKGPNGTTLSGATTATMLGGGSIVHGYKDSVDGSEMSESTWKKPKSTKRSEKKPKKEKKAKSSRWGKSSIGEPEPERDLGEEEMDVGVADTIRAYRHEKPARVGGLNREADGSAFDGSTDQGSSAQSELLSNREKTPTSTPTKTRKHRDDNYTGGIRKVAPSTKAPASTGSFWERATGTSSRREDEIKAEAKKLQEKGRAAQRRDFSFRAGEDESSVVSGGDEERRARREERRRRRAERERLPGSFVEGSELGSEVSTDLSSVGTKSYHHPIPGLSGAGGGKGDYAEERRKKRGYRREE